MRERVFTRRGKTPVLLVAPHGASDSNTVTLTKQAAELLDCYAVINQGFERNEQVDESKDLADCNRIDHIKQDVVFDEFLKPIIAARDAYRRKLQKGDPWAPIKRSEAILMLCIHGAGNLVHKEANEQVAAIIGYGLGHTKHSLTCQPWRVYLFIDTLRQVFNQGEIYEGQAGGKYAARSSNNLTQYFRKHDNDGLVDALQIEFPFSMRNTEDAAKDTGALLAVAVKRVLKHTHYHNVSHHKFI
jgi:hypothetical protein